jgi:galacturonosyltransferase
MPKVLILVNDNSTIYNFRRELLARLVTDHYKVFISVPSHPRNSEFVKMGCEVVETGINRFGTNLFEEISVIWKYIQLIRKVKPDVVLTYTAKPNIYGSLACQVCKVPYINNVTGLGSNFQTENRIKKIMLLLQKRAYRKSACVFFQNPGNKKYFEEKKIVGTNTALLPGSGVNLELHQPEPWPEGNTIRFIVVSRLRKDKGFDELFKAIPEVCKQYSNVEFHIVGWFEEEEYRKPLESMQKNFPVIYHGDQPQEKVHELMASCHCLIHPSWHEGMANVLLEGAAAARPCMASNIHGCKEAIDEGITGFLFEVKNNASLAKAILKFMALPQAKKKEMGQEGRKKMELEFDRNFVVNTYIRQIEKICIK